MTIDIINNKLLINKVIKFSINNSIYILNNNIIYIYL